MKKAIIALFALVALYSAASAKRYVVKYKDPDGTRHKQVWREECVRTHFEFVKYPAREGVGLDGRIIPVCDSSVLTLIKKY